MVKIMKISSVTFQFPVIPLPPSQPQGIGAQVGAWAVLCIHEQIQIWEMTGQEQGT